MSGVSWRWEVARADDADAPLASMALALAGAWPFNGCDDLESDLIMDKPRWQLARVVKAAAMPEAIGKIVWADHSMIEPCGGHGCEIPSMGVAKMFESPFGDGQDVMHIDALELLPEFADEIDPSTFPNTRRWMSMSDAEVRSMPKGTSKQ